MQGHTSKRSYINLICGWLLNKEVLFLRFSWNFVGRGGGEF